MIANLMDRVGEILRHAAATAVMPRFAALATGESRFKAPGEPVTIADLEAEALIEAGLRALLPGARVIGEEACAAEPALLDRLDEGAAWVIDPIDGTANFAAARAPFAMMVALLQEGETVASWILDPLQDRLAMAERGSGAWLEGERLLATSDEPAIDALCGIVSGAFCPGEKLPAVEALRRSVRETLPTARCAGHEYPLVATGARDFALYWRTLVWDHAPGALILAESGGAVRYLDGAAYQPASARTGLLLARNPHVSSILLEVLSKAD